VPAELLDGGTQSQLHSHLANREDCPAGAFDRDDDVVGAANGDNKSPIDFVDTVVESTSAPSSGITWFRCRCNSLRCANF